ncbi:MAG: hypothetical protein GY850_45010 [bacterium]|nr:hypothetical protein [bacterium]
MANFIGEKLDEWTISRKLFEDCQRKADNELLDEADAATIILREIWDRLRDSHKLRVLK